MHGTVYINCINYTVIANSARPKSIIVIQRIQSLSDPPQQLSVEMNAQMLSYQLNYTQLIAWMDVMKCSQSATARVLQSLEETSFLARNGRSLHEL